MAKNKLSAFDFAMGQVDGGLPLNAVLNNMFDKIAVQYLIDNFNFRNPLLNNYLKASSIYGGVDEIVSVGLAQLRQYNINSDWTKEKYFVDQFRVWAEKTYEDVYLYTTGRDQEKRAFLGEKEFGNAMALFARSIEDQKNNTWYGRIIEMHKKYPIIYEVTGTTPDEWGQEITAVMKRLTLPTTEFNIAGKPTAVPFDRQQLTWNAQAKNEAEWITARLFRQENIGQFGKFLNSEFVDYKDDSIIAVLDTQNSIYIGLKYQELAFQDIPANKYTNYYRHETYVTAIVPFEPGIIFKKAGGPTPTDKIELGTVITERGIKPDTEVNTFADPVEIVISEVTEESLLAAVKEANSTLTDTADLKVVFNTLIEGKGAATINAIFTNTKYTGAVRVWFTYTPDSGSGSNN